MVKDPLRTPLIEKAIKKTVKRGDAVFDLGCGLGLTTLFALKAGAKKVYACEVDESIFVAIDKIRLEKCEKKVSFYNCISSEAIIPEKVDVIIAETVGSLGLNENILPFTTDARNRFLKSGGQIIPCKIRVFLAPFGSPGKKENSIAKSLRGKKHVVDVSFRIGKIPPGRLFSEGKLYCDVNLRKIKKTGFDREIRFAANRHGTMKGFAGWVEIHWAPGVVTKTSPFDPPTHWKQAILPNHRTETIHKGDQITLRLKVGPKDSYFSTESLIEWGYQISRR